LASWWLEWTTRHPEVDFDSTEMDVYMTHYLKGSLMQILHTLIFKICIFESSKVIGDRVCFYQ